MVIRVDSSRHPFVELLWVRQARDLRPAGRLPPPLIDTPQRRGEPADRAVWEAAWLEIWESAASNSNPSVTALQVMENIRTVALGEDYRAWRTRHARRQEDHRPHSLAEEPERRSLSALIPAWRNGLTHVFTIPCHGGDTRIVDDSTLLVTEATRNDPDRYNNALHTFTQKK